MDTHKKLRNELLRADGITPHQVSDTERTAFRQMLKQKQPRMGRWRIIMRSRTFRVAIAAIILFVVGVTLYTWTGSVDITSRAYAVTDIPKLFHTASTIHIKGHIYYRFRQQEKPVPYDYEMWIDYNHKRWRCNTPTFYDIKNVESVKQNEVVYNGGKTMLKLDHTNHRASFYTITPLQRAMSLMQKTLLDLQKKLGGGDSLDHYQRIAQEDISGVMCDVWEDYHVVGGKQEKTTVWINPKTGDCLKARVWMRSSDDQDWSLVADGYVKRNVPMDDSLFAYTVPSGYKVTPADQTKPWRVLDPLSGSNGQVTLSIHDYFALADGSLLVCWSSRVVHQDTNQSQFFQGFHPGDDFPKLPVVVYALRQPGKNQSYIIPGRYLAHTIRDGIAYVWGVYSNPNRPTANRDDSFNFLSKTYASDTAFNVELGCPIGLRILNAQDFQKIVLPAMAEFSDDHQAPKVSYKTMMALTQ